MITRWETAQVDPCPECSDAEPVFDGFLTAAEGEWVKWEEVAAIQARIAELETDQRRHLEAIASEARCLGYLRTNLDEKQTRIATLERQLAAAREECKAWRDSHGSIGPQTPAEVPVFLREAARVDGQVAGYRIAALRAAIDAAVKIWTDCSTSERMSSIDHEALCEAFTLLRAAAAERLPPVEPSAAPAPAAMPDLLQRLIAFMRESDEWGTPADVMRSAEEAGLRIVGEAEAKVLKHSLAWLQSDNPIDLGKNEGMMVLALRRYEAELARRAQQKEKP